MSVKRFTGKDSHAVMRQVREVLGAEAIIVANRETVDGVEILATDSFDTLLNHQAVDEGIDALRESINTVPSSGAASASVVAAASQAPNSTQGVNSISADALTDPAEMIKQHNRNAAKRRGSAQSLAGSRPAAKAAVTDSVVDDISQLRGMLEQMAQSVGQSATAASGVHQYLTQWLQGAGFSAQCRGELLDQCHCQEKPEIATHDARNYLQSMLNTQDLDIFVKGGIYVFHGPCGSGKTTIISKIAASYLADHPPSGLVLVNSDNDTVGGNTQLESVAQTLGVSVTQVANNTELESLFKTVRRKKLVLVDTAGFSNDDSFEPENRIAMQSARRRVRHVLTLSASMQRSALVQLLNRVAGTAMESIILNKVDETLQLGIALESLVRSTSKLAYWSDSRQLHHRLHLANAEVLIDYAFAKSAQLDSLPLSAAAPSLKSPIAASHEALRGVREGADSVVGKQNSPAASFEAG